MDEYNNIDLESILSLGMVNVVLEAIYLDGKDLLRNILVWKVQKTCILELCRLLCHRFRRLQASCIRFLKIERNAFERNWNSIVHSPWVWKSLPIWRN